MPRGVAGVGREEPAQVAQAGRPEQRVGDRVEGDVAVRVAGSRGAPAISIPPSASGIAGSERMAVVTDPGPGRRSAPARALAAARRDRRAASP